MFCLLSRLFTRIVCFPPIPLFIISPFSSPQPRLLPIPHCLPSVPPRPSLSGAATPGCEPASPGRGEPVAPSLDSGPIVPSRPIILTPSPSILPPSTPTATIELSAPLDSLGPSAPPGSDIGITSLRTCGPFATLWPSTPTPLFDFGFAQATPRPSIVPAPPQPYGTLFPSRWGRCCSSVVDSGTVSITPLFRLSVCT